MNRLAIICFVFSICFFRTHAQVNSWFLGTPYFKMQFANDTFQISQEKTVWGVQWATNACYTDTQSKVAFFTGGKQLRNSSYAIINNGDKLAYNASVEQYYPDPDGLPITQGAIFIPVPGNPDQCYLFQQTLNVKFKVSGIQYWLPDRIYYQLIDMKANNGEGKVIQKNQILFVDTLITGLTAVKAANGKDYWLFAHEYNSGVYYRWLVTSNGLDGPFVQQIGFEMSKDLSLQTMGMYVFSQDGNYFASIGKLSNKVELYDFDRCAGLFFNRRNDSLPVSLSLRVVSGAFSFKGKNLFINSVRELYQYKVGDQSAFQNSRLFIDSADLFNEGAQAGFGQAMLGPDNIIYLSSWNGLHTLHRIKSPDNYGLSCNFQQHFITNLPGANASLPNMINYNLGALPIYTVTVHNDTLIHKGDTVRIGNSGNNPSLIYSWSPAKGLNDSTQYNPKCFADTTTTYILTVTDTSEHFSCNQRTDTVTITVDTATGIETPANNVKVNLYPNPVTDVLHLEFSAATTKENTLEIYNAIGQRLARKIFSRSERTVTLSTEEFSNGIYFLRVEEHGRTVYKSSFEVIK